MIMEGRRSQRGDNYRRSQNRKPPRAGIWQPTIPSWEKDFCKAVGTLDWETLLQMKKFMHLYNNVLNWDDSAGKEAFHNAKKRYWAEINGLSYDTPLPDPDLYNDQVNWDSEIKIEMLPDVENKSEIPDTDEEHDPVVIFGDSLFPNQAFSPSGWGGEEENAEVPVNHSSQNFDDPWEQNWRNSVNNIAATARPGHCVNTLQFSYGSGPAQYASCGSNWNDWGWSYADNYYNYLPPDIKDKKFDRQQRLWSDSNCETANARGYVWAPGDHERNHPKNHAVLRNDSERHKAPHREQRSGVERRTVPRKWNPVSSCEPVGHHAVMSHH